MTLLEQIIAKFIALAERIFNLIFGNVQFSVLWDWLPTDIQQAASAFIIILFALALVHMIRSFLPFQFGGEHLSTIVYLLQQVAGIMLPFGFTFGTLIIFLWSIPLLIKFFKMIF